MCKQGNEKQITLTDGRKKSCDECLQPIIQSLNDFGLQTRASCCGHGKQPANIILKDGREVMIFSNYQDARMVERLFEPLHPRKNEWAWFIRRKISRWFIK